jgi:hypothetical protein
VINIAPPSASKVVTHVPTATSKRTKLFRRPPRPLSASAPLRDEVRRPIPNQNKECDPILGAAALRHACTNRTSPTGPLRRAAGRGQAASKSRSLCRALRSSEVRPSIRTDFLTNRIESSPKYRGSPVGSFRADFTPACSRPNTRPDVTDQASEGSGQRRRHTWRLWCAAVSWGESGDNP